jgi:queuine/archaeosine tRNA-ribosyltransferase
MRVVAGLSIKNLHPRVWDPASPYYLSTLEAVMVSYGEFARMPAQRRRAMEKGLHAYLGAHQRLAIYLDNGAFSLMNQDGEVVRNDYVEFVRHARPDWYPIPQDYIPTPQMDATTRRDCLERTMATNRAYAYDGFVPVVHLGTHLDDYLQLFAADEQLMQKPAVALGGIVPNLLRMPKALAYEAVLGHVRLARHALAGKNLHVFGIGGTATLHLAALLSLDSVDSSGWRNRAARGIVQLPGSGDRMVTNLGSWRGRAPSSAEWGLLQQCRCPACRGFSMTGLTASALTGFCNRATHNLWTLLEEALLVETHLTAGTYADWYQQHLDNSIYLPLIRNALQHLTGS